MPEIVSKAISNGDSTNPIQASVVTSTTDPTKNGLVILNPDGTPAFKNPHPDTINFNTAYVPTGSEPIGSIYRDQANHTHTSVLEGGVLYQNGLELFTLAQNDTGATLANGKPVMYGGSIGNSGNQRMQLAVADGSMPEHYILGILTQDVLDGDIGKVTIHGKVRGIDTTGAPYSQTWVAGDRIWVSPTVVGGLTNVKPSSDKESIIVGRVINAHDTVGTLEVGIAINNYVPLSAIYDTKGLTGFIDNRNITVTGNSTDKKVTLTHGTEIVYYWRGVKKSLGASWTSTAHGSDTAKMYYLYTTDGVTFSWAESPRTFDDCMVTMAFYDSTLSKRIYTREIHGTYDYESHLVDHLNIGTFRTSGGTPTTGTYQLNSSVDNDLTPGFDAAVIYDEDLPSDIPARTQGTYSLMNVNNLGAVVIDTTKTFPYYNTAAGYINYFLNGVSTQGATNKYYNVYQILFPAAADTDSQKYRMLLLQPQAEYTSLSAAQSEDFNSLSLGTFANIAPEFVGYTRLTYGTNASYGTTGKVQLNGLTYLAGSKATQVTVTSPDKVSRFGDTMTGDLNIGLPDGTGGDNLRTYATLGEELFTNFNAASWTLTAGREATNDGGTQLNKNAAGVTTATLLGVAPTIGKIYKVVIGMNAMSVGNGATFSFGGYGGVNLTGVGTFTSYIYANTTGGLIITPTPTTTRFTINSISIKEVVNGTGSMYCENDLYLGGEILKPDGTQIIRFAGDGSIQFNKSIAATSVSSSGGLAAGGAISGATTIASSGANTNTQTLLTNREDVDGFLVANTTAATAITPVQNPASIVLSGRAWDSANRVVNRRILNVSQSDTVIANRLKFTTDAKQSGYKEIVNFTDTGECNVLGITEGTECLTNGALTSGTSRARTGDFALTGNIATYTHATGVGTIVQAAASLAVKLKPNRWYSFSYTMGGITGTSPTLFIPNTISKTKQHLQQRTVTGIIYFKTASTVTDATDFVINGTSGATGAINIDNFSLKEVSGGVVNSDIVNLQYLGEVIGADVASATTISPTSRIFRVTGTTPIATINLPYTGFTGTIKIIPTGIFTTTTAGNIGLATTAVVGKVLEMVYLPETSKRYPSY